MDCCMPMGCAIACSHFETFSRFLEWAVGDLVQTRDIVHYLDDFLFMGPKGSRACAHTLHGFAEMANALGVPLAADKTEGPATRLSFLGIEIDTVAGVCRLPQDKVESFRAAVRRCWEAKSVTLHQLQCLVGQLNFALRVVPMGKAFAKNIAGAMSGLREKHHHTKLSKEVKEDLLLWDEFLSDFNGTLIWREPPVANTELALFTDAAGSIGFGAILGNRWCMQHWPEDWKARGLIRNVTFLELFPIVVALVVWGTSLGNKVIVFWSDSMSVVSAINGQSACCPLVLRLVKFLVRLCLRHNIQFSAKHVPGVDNTVADALSRFKLAEFRRLLPGAEDQMTIFPPDLWKLGAPPQHA